MKNYIIILVLLFSVVSIGLSQLNDNTRTVGGKTLVYADEPLNLGTNALTLGGVSRTNWPTGEGSVSNWANYPANSNVDIGTNFIILGGEARSNWPISSAVQGTYPVFKLDIGNISGSWTDFEIKATTNNFTSLLYYYKSWTTQFNTNIDTNAFVYFTDDCVDEPRQWFKKANDIPISAHLINTNSVVSYVYFSPSHACVWSNWMYATNVNLIWSYVRVDDIGFEMNFDNSKQRWSIAVPEWQVERTIP